MGNCKSERGSPFYRRMKASFFSSSLSPSTPPRGGTKNSVDGSFTIVEGEGRRDTSMNEYHVNIRI